MAGERAARAATNSRSTHDSSGTSSSTIGRSAHRTSPARQASAARRNNAARSSTAAQSSCSSTRASRRPMSAAASSETASRSGVMPASRSSWSVRARAFGKPGSEATGAKYARSPAVTASNTARVAIASAPACVPGARRAPVSRPAATRAASSVKLNRVSPNVAFARLATARARSSAAPRDAPTITASAADGREERKCCAAPSRAAAEVEVTTRSAMSAPGPVLTTERSHHRSSRTPCRAFGNAALRRVESTR